MYRRFCKEEFDSAGRLTKFRLQIPEDFNFAYDVVDVLAAEQPQKRALVWCNTEGEERIFTFSELKTLSDKAANLFAGAGIGKGDTVLLILKRHWEYWVCALALHKIGAVAIPATHMLTVDDLCYRLEQAQVKAAVCTAQDNVPQNLKAAMERSGRACLCWSVQQEAEGFRFFNRELEAASERWQRVPNKATDPMLLYFTSGTTGYPKGVIHDHSYPLAHIVTAKYWQQAEDNGLHFTVAETGWAKASWGKLYGQWLVGSAVMVYDFDNFEPKQLCSVINRYGVTSFCAPPTVYRYLVRKGVPDMPSLRHASTAGEMLAKDVFLKFEEKTGLQLAEGYGQTETTLLCANFKGAHAVEGSMGTASPFYDIVLLGRDGKPVPQGEIGEVCIVPPKDGRQAGIFSGYLNDDAKYEHVWRGGVYHSGDSAWQDAKGQFWFHGRFDDIIKTGGYRVGPYEVEHVLAAHPAVQECSVIGVPDPLRGQAIKAVVQLQAGRTGGKELEKELKDFCNSRLAEYKWVRCVEFIDAMPKTISGKIRKGELRKQAQA